MKKDFSFGSLRTFYKVFLILPILCLAYSLCILAAPGSTLSADRGFDGSTIIGILQTKSKSVTIFLTPQGPVYSVYSRSGRSIAYKLSHKELLATYPELEQTISRGLAGNDASLYLK